MAGARRAFGAAILAAALLAVSCGGSGDDASPPASSAAGDRGNGSDSGSGGGGAAGAGAGCQVDEPITVASLVEIKGESNVAVDDFHNGALMAVEEINADGGICGQEVQLERIPTSAVDAQAARASLLKAADLDPAIIIGFPNSSIVTALIDQIDRVAIPTITMGGSPSAASRMDPNSSQWLWGLYLPNSVGPLVDDTVSFMVDDLGATELGLLYADVPTFLGAKQSFQQAIPAAGGALGPERGYALADIDLTQQVLALDGVDGIINWGFPNQMAISLKQQQQNGVDVPNIGPFAGSVVVDQGLAEGATGNFYGAMICNPVESEPEWAERYRTRFPGEIPNQGPAAVYDSVFIFRAAVEQAASVEHDAVRQAIDDTDHSGVCSKAYYADETGTLGHGVTIVSYADGTSKTVKEFAPVPMTGPIP